MSAKEIVQVLERRLAGEAALTGAYGSQALVPAQKIGEILVPRLEQNPMYAAIWQQFQADPSQAMDFMIGAVEKLLAADAALTQQMKELLAQLQPPTPVASSVTIASGERSVAVGGDASNNVFQSGDIHSEGAYFADKVSVSGGDLVGRDKTVTQTGADVAKVTALFEQALELARAPSRPAEEQEDLEAAVEMAREEAQKGEEADASLLNRSLDVLLERGPDVLELVLRALTDPAGTAGKAARMLARQIQRKRQEKTQGGQKGSPGA